MEGCYAENKNESGCGKTIQNHGVRKNCQKQGLFEPYSDQEEHEAKAKSQKVGPCRFRKFPAGEEADPIRLMRYRGADREVNRWGSCCPGKVFGSSVKNGFFSRDPGYYMNYEGQKCQG